MSRLHLHCDADNIHEFGLSKMWVVKERQEFPFADSYPETGQSIEEAVKSLMDDRPIWEVRGSLAYQKSPDDETIEYWNIAEKHRRDLYRLRIWFKSDSTIIKTGVIAPTVEEIRAFLKERCSPYPEIYDNLLEMAKQKVSDND